MRGDIVLSGFVLTAEEWAAMDRAARVQSFNFFQCFAH